MCLMLKNGRASVLRVRASPLLNRMVGAEYPFVATLLRSELEFLLRKPLPCDDGEVEKAVRQLEGVPVERIKRPFCPIFWRDLGNPNI